MLFKNKTEIIAIDHGYGNVKTAHCCFKTGVTAYEKEPVFKNNLLEYEGKRMMDLRYVLPERNTVRLSIRTPIR